MLAALAETSDPAEILLFIVHRDTGVSVMDSEKFKVSNSNNVRPINSQLMHWSDTETLWIMTDFDQRDGLFDIETTTNTFFQIKFTNRSLKTVRAMQMSQPGFRFTSFLKYQVPSLNAPIFIFGGVNLNNYSKLVFFTVDTNVPFP